MTATTTTPAPIVLVPGYWLGAWAWDEVVEKLRGAGHTATAITLPGLDAAETDRSGITQSDHVAAIVAAVRAAGRPVVLAVHSASGFAGYAASDQIPSGIAAMVYVDSAPGVGAGDPDFAAAELPLPPPEKLAGENQNGLSAEQLATFRRRAVPQPGGTMREAIPLTNDARRDIPSTIICTGYSVALVQEAVKDGDAWLAGVPELRDVTWVELPTSHWPMWSRPGDLAAIIGRVADAHAGAANA